MKINLDEMANSAYAMFNLNHDRAASLLDEIALICENAYTNSTDYTIGYVDKQENGSDEILYRLNIAKMLSEMVALATTEDEKNYVLYTSFIGINRTNKILFYSPIS